MPMHVLSFLCCCLLFNASHSIISPCKDLNANQMTMRKVEATSPSAELSNFGPPRRRRGACPCLYVGSNGDSETALNGLKWGEFSAGFGSLP